MLAGAWSGPAELFAALASVPGLADFSIEIIAAEVQTAFDEHEGGKRNHDLVIEGAASAGQVVVCVEAKAGETLGPTVAEQEALRGEEAARERSTNAPERLRELVVTWTGQSDLGGPSVKGLRYQLFTAIAGTVAEARSRECSHAVLMIHDFLTDDRPTADTRRALEQFADVVFHGMNLPDEVHGPWCVEAPLPESVPGNADVTFHLAHAVTDLRPRPSRTMRSGHQGAARPAHGEAARAVEAPARSSTDSSMGP